MEAHQHHPLNEIEISDVVISEGPTAGWRLVELVEEGELSPDVLEMLPTHEEQARLAEVVHLGQTATGQSVEHPPIAA